MTAIGDALARAGLVPEPRGRDSENPVIRDAARQLSSSYWNHGCAAAGCSTVVPRHRTHCLEHGGAR